MGPFLPLDHIRTSGMMILQQIYYTYCDTDQIFMAALHSRCEHYILPCGFFFLFFFFFSSPNLSGRRVDIYHTSTHGVALVRIYNAGLKCAARGSMEIQDAKNRHLQTITQLCRAVSSQPRHASTIGKNLLNSSISSTCLHNMVNFGPLVAEICWRVWGIAANFNVFHILAALLHDTLVVGVSQTLWH